MINQITKIVENKINERKGVFLYVWTLEPPVLGNMLTGKGEMRATIGVAKELKGVVRGRLRSTKQKLI